MKRTTFKNIIIFSNICLFLTIFMSIGFSAITRNASISSDVDFVLDNMLVNNTDYTKFLDCSNISNTEVVTINFNSSAPSSYVKSCDVSANGDGSIMAYVVTSGNVVIHSNDGVVFSNTKTKFTDLINCNTINFNGLYNTSHLISLSVTFRNLCSNSGCSMTNLDLSSFDTRRVTNMTSTFAGASNVSSIDVSSFNTSSVKAMIATFKSCSSLTTLNLGNFDTSKVYTINAMFEGCTNLNRVYVGSGWTMSNIGNCPANEPICNGDNMFYQSDLYSNHPYSWCNGVSTNAHLYAHIDGGPSNPGCLDDVSNLNN